MVDRAQHMFFRSIQVEAQWDTWMYYHQGVFYLYYLIAERSTGEGFGLATSSDGVTWTDRGWVLRASDKMVTYLGTGAVWKSPDFEQSGRFVCNYSEWRQADDHETQNILFAWSDDLIQWHKYGDEHLFPVDTRWYDPYGRWDCIFPLPRAEGGYYGYWTATPKEAVGFGVGQSDDGLHWQALPAPTLIWDDVQPPQSMEAGATERFGERYYAMTGQSRGMWTMVADHPTGPFVAASKNRGLLTNSGPHKHTYFARFVRTPDGVLVNHHAITRAKNAHGRPICYFAPLKLAHVDQQGTLWLRYWRGNAQIKRRPVPMTMKPACANLRMISESLDGQTGVILEGTMTLPQPNATEDLPGLYVACDASSGAAILVSAQGVTQFGLMQLDHQDQPGETIIEDTMARAWPFGDRVRFRLLLKESLIEFYLDDVFIQSFSMPSQATGRIGLLGGGAVSDVAAWEV